MSYTLCDFGSYTVAGRVIHVTEGEPRDVAFTRSARYTRDPRGHFAVEQAYVQYFVPAPRNEAPPVVLVHGGGMHGSTWETTPDGRPGWLNLLLRQGYEVHVLDNVERGRSGFAPGLWAGEPLARSQEEAWSLFRIGPPEGFATRRPFPGTRFPVGAFDAFTRMFVPRWLTTTPLQVAALVAVLRRTGPATVVSHSQGGEIMLDAVSKAPELFAALVGIEPSTTVRDVAILRDIPTVLFAGDFLDSAAHWQTRAAAWRDWIDALTAIGGRAVLLSADDGMAGHTHFPMFDHGSEQCLATCLRALADLQAARP